MSENDIVTPSASEQILFIPYYGSDRGDRPLLPSVPAAFCPYIWPDQKPGNQIVRGRPSTLKFMVRYNGPSSPQGTVINFEVSWQIFSLSTPKRYTYNIGQRGIPAGDTWILTGGDIPISTINKHICLLVEVYFPDGTPRNPPLPGLDGRWAQLNLADISATNRQFRVEFDAGNDSSKDQIISVYVRPLSREKLKFMIMTYGYNLESYIDMKFKLEDLHSGKIGMSDANNLAEIVHQKFHPGENRTFSVEGDFSSSHKAGQFIALEAIETVLINGDNHIEVGSGIIVIEIK